MYRLRPCRLVALPLGLLIALVVGAGVGAQAYPPNTVVSRYSDARYCGDGQISVVTDGSGALMDVCTRDGSRIYPVADGTNPYGAPFANPGAQGGVPYFPPGYAPSVPGTAPYTVPSYGAPSYAPGVGIVPGASGTSGITGTVIRQYYDGNSNCPSGDVTQTTSGFYCTATGQPAAANGGVPVYNPAVPGTTQYGVPPYTTGTGYLPGYGTSPYGGINTISGYNSANGTVVRQYNDGNSNCPGGDVTQTTIGFYCTANGQPAARVG